MDWRELIWILVLSVTPPWLISDCNIEWFGFFPLT